MANELVFSLNGLTLSTVNARIFNADGSMTWDGTGMSAVDGLDDIDFSNQGVISLTAIETSDNTVTGDWRGDWPSALATGGYYRVKVYDGSPVPNEDIAEAAGYWNQFAIL